MNWYRYSSISGDNQYFLPFIDDRGEDEEEEETTNEIDIITSNQICANAIGNILDWGRQKSAKVRSQVANNTIPTHGNKRKEKQNTKFNNRK